MLTGYKIFGLGSDRVSKIKIGSGRVWAGLESVGFTLVGFRKRETGWVGVGRVFKKPRPAHP